MLRSIAEKRYHHAYIDGLRGVAILLVLVQHTYRALLQLPKPMSFPFLGGFLTTGGLGVPLFFIVSAFTLFRLFAEAVGKREIPDPKFLHTASVSHIPAVGLCGPCLRRPPTQRS